MKKHTSNYQRHRFPSEIISHAVLRYHHFCLSFREVEELLAERSITVTYETIRQWRQGLFKFGRRWSMHKEVPTGGVKESICCFRPFS